jgi:hypothetical protein
MNQLQGGACLILRLPLPAIQDPNSITKTRKDENTKIELQDANHLEGIL